MQRQPLPFGLALFSILLLLSAITLINYHFEVALGLTGVTLLYLLVVITSATFFEFLIAFITACIAFLAINFFFTEPRFTFSVTHLQSWVSLCCFLVVSLLIASLVKQLKYQTQQALLASNRAQFSRVLAEKLALASDLDTLFKDTCQLLHEAFQHPVAIATKLPDQAEHATIQTLAYVLLQQSGAVKMPDQRLVQWVCENGKAISPYTDYWTENLSTNKQWLIPFNRLPSHDPILIVDQIDANDTIETFNTIKACVDQISQAYQRLVSTAKAQQAELEAQEEAIQNALLASISHDMRTPLTAILGAATTLEQTPKNNAQSQALIHLIASQTRYLAQATENILSLVRLESTSSLNIPFDWQSPEELVGVVATLYKNRGDDVRIEPTIIDNRSNNREVLIKANAGLITQALVNLIDNAQRVQLASQPIHVIVEKSDQYVRMSVEDHGPGFSPEFDIAEVKKFSTTQAKGFGLGLSIVKAIAKSHHATLTVSNKMDGNVISGASVTLTFQALSFDEMATTNATFLNPS